MTRSKGKPRKNAPNPQKRSNAIVTEDMANARFENYYRAQNILTDDEWPAFLERMRAPLPTTFRVAGSRQTASILNELIKTTHTQNLTGVEFDGAVVAPPVQIAWYPEGLAWQFDVPKVVLRKQAAFKKFHSFLVYETEVGNISRQEAVSMIPPLLLDVEPHHRVIDMCAAPGSKTAQLLEALHAQDSLSASSTPSGLLIANDSDNKRAHMLIHQSARLPSPALLVTNLDASIYPIIHVPEEFAAAEMAEERAQMQAERGKEAAGRLTRSEKRREHALLFDRILCDVPCSGDGTMRKNPDIWRRWGAGDGLGLHALQLRILQRAMRMLKFGGRLVYSTCSLNPVENEAVIAAALQSIPGFALVDVSDRLPELVRRPGLTTWKPSVSKEPDTSFASFEAFAETLSEEQKETTKVTPGHWPPPKEEAEALGLNRCLRIYPHLQDTGGFFVAVLEKKSFVPSTAPAASKRQAEEVDDAAEPDAKKARLDAEEADDAAMADEAPADSTSTEKPKARQGPKKKELPTETGGSFKENPYTFLSPDDPSVLQCMQQLRLDPSFPTSHLFTRNSPGDPVRALYLANPLARAVLLANRHERLRLLSGGTKVFVKQGAEASASGSQFRVLADGLPVVMPFVRTEHVLLGDLSALRTLMEGYYPLCTAFLQGFRAQIESLENGSYIARFPPEEWGGASISHELLLPIWKSNVSVCLMIDKKAKSALSLRLFGEDVAAARNAAAKQLSTADANAIETEVQVPVTDAQAEQTETVGETEQPAGSEEVI